MGCFTPSSAAANKCVELIMKKVIIKETSICKQDFVSSQIATTVKLNEKNERKNKPSIL